MALLACEFSLVFDSFFGWVVGFFLCGFNSVVER